MTIANRLAEVVRVDPLAPAVESRRQWTSWGQLASLTHAIEAMLDETDVPEGGRVGILLRNRIPQLAALIACIVSSRCTVSFNPLLPPNRLAADIQGQAPRVLIGALEDFDNSKVRAAAEQACTRLLCLPTQVDGTVTWRSAATSVARTDALRPDVLVEMLTSGTTGAPKRRPIYRASIDEAFAQGLNYERGRKEGVALRSGVRLVTSPLLHISGLFGAISTLADGRKLALLEKFSVTEWVSAIERHQCRVANLPPAALRMLLDADIPKASLASLLALRTGTAPLNPEVVDTFLERYDLPVLNQYGATEFAGSVAGWDIKEFRDWYRVKRGSAGKVHANIEARIVNPESGEPLALGEVGLLELRGNQLGDSVNWTRTTDRASLDDDRFLWIHGRADNTLIRGGFKVQPDDVARAIEAHPAVKEAVVVGLRDARLGEVPGAAVVLDSAMAAPGEAALREFLAKTLLPYEMPTSFRFVSELPRTPSLKPSTPDIRRLFEEEETDTESSSAETGADDR